MKAQLHLFLIRRAKVCWFNVYWVYYIIFPLAWTAANQRQWILVFTVGSWLGVRFWWLSSSPSLSSPLLLIQSCISNRYNFWIGCCCIVMGLPLFLDNTHTQALLTFPPVSSWDSHITPTFIILLTGSPSLTAMLVLQSMYNAECMLYVQ